MNERTLHYTNGLPERVIVVTNKNIDSIGGQQASIRNMLRFPGDWTLLSPYQPENQDNTHFIRTRKDLVIPGTGKLSEGSSAHLVNPFTRRRIVSELQERDPKAILIDDWDRFYGMSLYAILPPELKDRTYALWRGIVNAPFDPIEDSAAKKVFKTTHRKLALQFARSVKSNLAVSNAVAQSLESIGVPAEKIVVIPEIIGNEFNPEQRRQDKELPYEETNRAKYLESDELGILFVGRIKPAKGVEWIADLYEQLQADQQNFPSTDGNFKKVKITVVGPVAPAYRSFFEGVTNRIATIRGANSVTDSSQRISYEYVGPKSPVELQSYYNAYDILFMPSFREAFGRTTAEAMRGGMTVLGREQTAATNEILSTAQDPTGILIDSPQAGARQIIHLMHNPNRLGDMQANAMHWSNNYFSLEEASTRIWTILDTN